MIYRCLTITLLSATCALAQLPHNYQLQNDWLLNGADSVARIDVNKTDRTFILQNGLISRTVDARLGCTTAFLNLMTGESIIRAVEPEGSVTIDGVTYPIGGAQGQPNKAFLTAEWLRSMEPLPGALQLAGYEVGEPKERLAWKRSRHHEADAKWPPAGKYLRIDYQLPAPGAVLITDLMESQEGRKCLFKDDFSKMDASWTVSVSDKHPRSSFENEGKAGEIYTLPDTAVIADRGLPRGTQLVEAEIHCGTDDSTSWGPGIGLVFSNGKAIKFHIRPGGLAGVNRPVLGVFDGKIEHPNVSGEETINSDQPIFLRARFTDEEIYFDARQQGGRWKHYKRVRIPHGFGKPEQFRVGKLSYSGGSDDRDGDGQLVRLRINHVAFFSKYTPSKSTTARQTEKKKIVVSVHYEIYDGIPVIRKWITVQNNTSRALNVDRFNTETLSVVEYENQTELRDGVTARKPRALHVETDMAFGGMTYRNANRHTVKWHTDKTYSSQVNYLKEQPCLLKVEPTFGPDQTVAAGETFTGFNVFELVHDSGDRERRGLAIRRMYRTVAPWVTENPLMLHCTSSDENTVKQAIDQAKDVGFEVVILSFGSGFNAEDDSSGYQSRWEKMNDYALGKGIHLGGYSLYSSRRIGGGQDIVPPRGMKNAHNSCPAITSPWGQEYIDKLYLLFDKTGFMVFENDGTYPGDVDVTPRLPLQKGVNDSRWVHWKTWTQFYQFLRSRGVYINLPDFYYLSGANKCTMGYREVNWSLPREQQRIHTRQNIYDGTWQKIPSMGWMFVPLTQYHGGGSAATIEPLEQHCDHYETMLLSNLGLGVQACYRGPRLYDTEKTKSMVKNTVTWFKKHREILESDMIHGRRSDGMDIDWMLHVNPKLEEKALLSAYNPTDREITKTIMVPLYYANLRNRAHMSANGNPAQPIKLDTSARAKVTVTIPAQGFGYYIFNE